MSGSALGGTTVSALSSLGSDLSVSVSFTIARELLEGAQEASISEDELVGIVLSVSIIFTAIENLIGSRLRNNLEKAVAKAEKMQRQKNVSESEVVSAAKEEKKKLLSQKSGLDFLQNLVSIARQVSFAIAIQLLAASARAKEPSRTVRILSLISLVIFFLFVSSNGQRRIF